MRNVFLKFLFLIIVCFSVLPVEIYAKKEKKPYQWEMPKKLSGVKEMDEYLLACDTLWNKIQAYKDSITFFHLDTLKRMVNGQPCYVIKIVDEEGQERSFSQSIMQGIDIITDNPLLRKTAMAVFPWRDSNANMIVFGDTRGGTANFRTFENLLSYYTDIGDHDNINRVASALNKGVGTGKYNRNNMPCRSIRTV